MRTKQIDIADLKVFDEEGASYITGYANTKGVADSYGDIPMSINGEPVYDLTSRFERNPVALVDHGRSVGNIFGVFVLGPGATYEDERGLRFKLRLMDNPKTAIAQHAVEAYKSGFARALSIGGEWLFKDPKNKKHLTKAIIYEISGVAIGADSFAVTEKPYVKSEKTEDEDHREVLEILIEEYRKSLSSQVLKAIEAVKHSRKGF